MTDATLMSYAERELKYQARKKISNEIRKNCAEGDPMATSITVMLGTRVVKKLRISSAVSSKASCWPTTSPAAASASRSPPTCSPRSLRRRAIYRIDLDATGGCVHLAGALGDVRIGSPVPWPFATSVDKSNAVFAIKRHALAIR